MSKIQPVNDYILIEPEKAKEKTESGIYLSDSGEGEKPQQGKVVSVGPGVKNVNVGDIIVYSKYGPTVVKVDDDENFFIQDSDVIAIIGK